MLSGVATDSDAGKLVSAFSNGELVRNMELIEKTLAAFTRSASRRMDAELCIINLCHPELQLDAKGLNARLTRLEDQIRSGSIQMIQSDQTVEMDERPPVPSDEDAPLVPEDMFQHTPMEEESSGAFWIELVAAVRQELRPPISGFFVSTPNSPIQGVLRGNQVVLKCNNQFIQEMINKPEILALVGRKASAQLGRQVSVVTEESSANPEHSGRMEQLLSFGRAHSDIIRIKE